MFAVAMPAMTGIGFGCVVLRASCVCSAFETSLLSQLPFEAFLHQLVSKRTKDMRHFVYLRMVSSRHDARFPHRCLEILIQP